jgi:hypothetical protein
MENVFYNEKYYSEIEEILLEEDWQTEEDLPDHIEVYEAHNEPIVKLSAQWIVEHIDEERFTEDGCEIESVEDILNKYIDFQKVNSMIPKLWYEGRKKIVLTKEQLKEYL